MTNSRTVKEHNISRLNILEKKIDVAENKLEKEAALLHNRKVNEIDSKISSIKKNLKKLDLKLNKIEENLNFFDFSNFLERKPVLINRAGFGKNLFKSFICVLFVSLVVFFGIIGYQGINIGITPLSEIYIEQNLKIILDSLNYLDVKGSIWVGVMSSFVFIVLLASSYMIKENKEIKKEKKIEEILNEYEIYINSKISSLEEVLFFIKKLEKHIDFLSILLDEFYAKLKIYIIQKDELDLNMVKDISRIQKVIEDNDILFSLKVLDEDDNLSFEISNKLNESIELLKSYDKKNS